MPFVISQVFVFTLLSSLCITIILTLGMFFVNSKISERITAIIFVAGILVWVQGNLLVWNFGILDGSDINWGNFNVYLVLELLIWLLFLGWAFIKYSSIYRFIRTGSIFLFIIQGVTIVISAVQAPTAPDWKELKVTYKDEFSYSKQKNIVVLVLDTFQTDLFQELLNEDQNLKDEFKGFTYFRNAMGGFPTTYASVSLMLTGQYYDNGIPAQQFFENAFKSETSLPKILKDNDYKVELYPISNNTVHLNKDIISNVSDSNVLNNTKGLKGLYSASFFKYTPIVIKKYIYDSQSINKLHSRDLEFVKSAEQSTQAKSDGNIFKFIHLAGVHLPFQLNEKLEETDIQMNRSGYQIQAKAAVEITKKYLESLKTAGVYDQTMIVIVGDHGSFHFGVNTQAKNGAIGKDGTDINSAIVGSGIPLILVKPFGENSDLKVSDAPVTLADIPKTVLKASGIENSIPGSSMFDINENEARLRKFYYYRLIDGDRALQYLPPMEEYQVNGYSWLQQSWNKSFKKFSPGQIIDETPLTYQYGTEIVFGSEGNSANYKDFGWWGTPESNFTWTDGPVASLYIPLQQSSSDLKLTADLEPYLPESIKEQKVNVYVNEHKLGQWIAQSNGKYTMTIPKNLTVDSSIKLEFELPDAVSPSSLNISSDIRNLGIAMKSVVITQLPSYVYGTDVRFDKDGNSKQYLETGWSIPETDFTWTNGNRASLVISTQESTTDVMLTATLTPFITESLKSQTVLVFANGENVGRWIVEKGGEYQMLIPAKYVKDSPLRLEFELPDAQSPKALNLSEDDRMLGLAVKSMRLTNK